MESLCLRPSQTCIFPASGVVSDFPGDRASVRVVPSVLEVPVTGLASSPFLRSTVTNFRTIMVAQLMVSTSKITFSTIPPGPSAIAKEKAKRV